MMNYTEWDWYALIVGEFVTWAFLVRDRDTHVCMVCTVSQKRIFALPY